MALDTLGNLKTYIQRARRDASGDTATYTHWTEEQTEDDINNAIQEFWDEVPSGTTFEVFAQVSGGTDAEYVPTTAANNISEIVHLQTDDRRLIPITPSELFERDSGWNAREGEPTHFIPNYRRTATEKMVIRVWPTPAAVLTDLRGEFTREHPWLTGDSDRLLVPLPYRMAIVAYALHLGYAADKQETQDLTKAAYWLGRYQHIVRRAKRKTARHFDRSASQVTLQR